MATRVFLSSLFRSTAKRFHLSRRSPTNALLSRFSEYYSPVVAKTDDEITAIFEDWMEIYNKSYPSEEEKERRYKIFKEKVLRIDNQNRKFEAKGLKCRSGLYDFADLTREEFTNTHYGYVVKEIAKGNQISLHQSTTEISLLRCCYSYVTSYCY